MWWKKSLKEVIRLISEGKADSELIKDWIVAYEIETEDKSLRSVEDPELFLILILNQRCLSYPDKHRLIWSRFGSGSWSWSSSRSWSRSRFGSGSWSWSSSRSWSGPRFGSWSSSKSKIR